MKRPNRLYRQWAQERLDAMDGFNPTITDEELIERRKRFLAKRAERIALEEAVCYGRRRSPRKQNPDPAES